MSPIAKLAHEYRLARQQRELEAKARADEQLERNVAAQVAEERRLRAEARKTLPRANAALRTALTTPADQLWWLEPDADSKVWCERRWRRS